MTDKLELQRGDIIVRRRHGRWMADMVGEAYHSGGWNNPVEATRGLCLETHRARWQREDKAIAADRKARRAAGIPWWKFWEPTPLARRAKEAGHAQ